MTKIFYAVLSACLLSAPLAAQEQSREITGSLTYMERIALPPDAEVIVTARGAFDTILGEARAAQVTPLAFATEFDCQGEPVALGILGDRATLRLRGRDVEMEQVQSGSGSKFVSVGEDAIEFWGKGRDAMLSISGEKIADCTEVPENEAPYTARGNEPGWTVTVGAETIKVVADYGVLTRSAPRPDVQVSSGAYIFEMPEIGARLTLMDRLCHDGATGMPYPHVATLALDDRELRGCGGSAADLLTGTEWTVEDISGEAVIEGSMPTLAFTSAGRVSGGTGCNRFFGSYTLTGEGLNLGRLGATMMACPDALMRQERRMFDTLKQVRRFDIGEGGALLLIGGPEDEVLLTARR